LSVLGASACALSVDDEDIFCSLDLQDAACKVCDLETPAINNTSSFTLDDEHEITSTLLTLLSLVNKSTKARTTALTSLRRILKHSTSPPTLKLGESSASELILQSLRSSSRDIRLTAAQSLVVFVTRNSILDADTLYQNRIIVLDSLHTLWSSGKVPLQETAVLSLTNVAQVIEDEELNIILVRLVEYLGSGNPYINGLVYSELQRLAQSLQVTVAALFRPFWRTVGAVVIKHFQNRPSISQQLSDLLGMDVDGLLILIEEYALPYLVLARKIDVIQRIALLHGPSTSPFHICTQRKHLAPILALLLAQSFPDPEEAIMSMLVEVSAEFADQDLAGWIGLEPIQIACELLKAIVDSGEGRGARTHQALQLLSQLMSKRSSQSSGNRKSDIISSFLEHNALAIITQFTVVLNELEVVQPNIEKRRCLAAIGQIVKLGKSRIAPALPQICGCLRSALDNKQLCDTAFGSWVLMLNSLKEEDVEPLVDQTLAIIVRSWELFDTSTQQKAYKLVADLLQKHTKLIREIFETMPSLSSIPVMAKFEAEIGSLKRQMDERHQFMAFIRRLDNENLMVIEQALQELLALLRDKHEFLTRCVLREPPDTFIVDLTRALLDTTVKYSSSNKVTLLGGQCLGWIGCLDPSKMESTREKKSIVVLSNFTTAKDTIDFVLFFLENVLVPAFLSASTTRAQGFLGWAMQHLLRICEFDTSITLRSRTFGSDSTFRRWLDLPETVRNTLTPFLSSKYTVQEVRVPEKCQYPLFVAGAMSYQTWLRIMTLDFLYRSAPANAKMVFEICQRIIHGQDIAVAAFLLPFTALNVLLSGIVEDREHLRIEMLSILQQPIEGDHQTRESIRQCSESVFEILDYMTKWHHQRKKKLDGAIARGDRGEITILNAKAGVDDVEELLASIPADVISQRAIECKSYARALFHWEQHIRASEGAVDLEENEKDARLERLQEIYAQIDEPDGIEGISSKLQVLNIDQQILEHRKAGRWTAAQSWYELQLNDTPDDPEIQINLMQCLKESGQHEVLLHHFDGLDTSQSLPFVLPYAVESAWVSGRWDKLTMYVAKSGKQSGNFDVSVAKLLLCILNNDRNLFSSLLSEVYQNTTESFSANSIGSLQTSHDIMLRLHVLTDLRRISEASCEDKTEVLTSLQSRLSILGSYVGDKQYLLGVRRAAMQLSNTYAKEDVAAEWLASARLARKANSNTQAFNAILRASTLGEKSATIEQAKLTWKEGHHRKAIQTLEGAIESKAFATHDSIPEDGPMTMTKEQRQEQNQVAAKAYGLLGKWLDAAGQTQSEEITKTFRKATEYYKRWDKGWYLLGKHYNKILDSERSKPPGKESQTYLTGEATKVVIENYLRSLIGGSKYVFQTLPKVLTLWLELVSSSDLPQDARRGNEKFHNHNAAQRKRVIDETNAQMKKYAADRLHPSLLYTILPQVVARICNPNPIVYSILTAMVVKVVRSYPQQALWTLLAVIQSQSKDRASRGNTLMQKIVEVQKKSSKDSGAAELKALITTGQRFSLELLRISDFTIEGKVSRVSLTRDLGFNHKTAPSRLVVPVQSFLTATLPMTFDSTALKSVRVFSKDAVTITAFMDEAMVLASLQKPRKLTIRGSDGNLYGVLAKPKDDMRKDQRLMEFNTMINRFLKRDVEASKRRLYIKTYAVVPLNEECGLIEWVDNLKTFRDILLSLYKERRITPNYNDIRIKLEQACANPPETTHIFKDQILSSFPPVFHDWFVDSFPDPFNWFNARLRYTRSAAVMSMVGHVLGLGDRHGENILFEEDNGGTLHVDFNCLFDKGLTFEKPECVPFRLTHNMVDAFGAYGYDGPFRRCCEITLTLLRGNEDALMTILETFLHDPTTDFLTAGKRKRNTNTNTPDTPLAILDAVRGKVKGMLPGESVPLSVGGYVEEMIKQATDHANLCKMYIGWCAFF
jgi:serine/threonine-protein kinase ATR